MFASQTSSSPWQLAQHAISAISLNGFTRLVITSAMKNSKNLTSEKGEYSQWKIAMIVGNLMKLWKMSIGMKKITKNTQHRMVANRSMGQDTKSLIIMIWPIMQNNHMFIRRAERMYMPDGASRLMGFDSNIITQLIRYSFRQIITTPAHKVVKIKPKVHLYIGKVSWMSLRLCWVSFPGTRSRKMSTQQRDTIIPHRKVRGIISSCLYCDRLDSRNSYATSW